MYTDAWLRPLVSKWLTGDLKQRVTGALCSARRAGRLWFYTDTRVTAAHRGCDGPQQEGSPRKFEITLQTQQQQYRSSAHVPRRLLKMSLPRWGSTPTQSLVLSLTSSHDLLPVYCEDSIMPPGSRCNYFRLFSLLPCRHSVVRKQSFCRGFERGERRHFESVEAHFRRHTLYCAELLVVYITMHCRITYSTRCSTPFLVPFRFLWMA